MAVVQTITKANSPAGTPVTSLLFDSATFTAGNTLVVRVKWEANSMTSVTDGTNGTYTLETVEVHSGANIPSVGIAHIGNITGFTGQVTMNFGGAGSSYISATLTEYNGMPAAANNRDKYTSAEGTQSAGPTTPPLSSDITTAQATEVCCAIIGAAAGQTFSALQINSVTGTTISTTSDTVTFDTYPTSTFTGHANGSMNVNAKWVIALATFNANAASGATPTVVSKHIGRSLGIGIGKGIFN